MLRTGIFAAAAFALTSCTLFAAEPVKGPERFRGEIDRMDRDARDPRSKMRNAERALRKEGFAKPGEIVYRIEGSRPDTLAR